MAAAFCARRSRPRAGNKKSATPLVHQSSFCMVPRIASRKPLFAGKPISTNQICCFRLMWLYSGMNKVKALKQIRQRETSNRDTHSLFCLKDEPKWMN
ncbi:MAG: hypothetical protein WA146_09975 [Thiobacillus sp.]